MHPTPLPDPFDGRPFSVRAAIEAGINPERLRRSDLTRPFRGVRLPVVLEPTQMTLCEAFVTRMPDDGVFSHVTAARLLGIPLPKRLGTGQQLHVATRPPRRSIRAEGVVGHKLDLGPSDVVQLSEVPLTSAARTWTDLANLLTVEDLVVAGDFLLWRRNPLASIGDLRAACSRTSGKRGAAKLRIALPLLTDRSDSPPESRIRYRFLRGGLPAAIPNLDLHDDRGRFLARPDLTFVEYREVYDYEGDHHRTDAVQWEKDLARIPSLEQANWHSTRGSKRDLQNTGQLIERLGRILRSKGWDGRRVSSRLP